MQFWRIEIQKRLMGLDLDPAREAAIVEELSQHLEDFYQEALASGSTPAEARGLALAELSGRELLAGELRRIERQPAPDPIVLGANRRSNMIADLWQDLRFGARMLWKNAGFTVIAVATLALGVGANTAIFSVIHTVLLQPLPFPEPDRLVVLATRSVQNTTRTGVAYPDYADWSQRAQSFEGMACFLSTTFSLTDIERPISLPGRRVNWNYFSMLDVKPEIGRLFSPDDDRVGAASTAILSHRLWEQTFGGDPAIIGKTIRVDGAPYEVIGVTPPEFEFLRRDDLYLPIGLSLTPTFGLLERRNQFPLNVLARLKPGVSEPQARVEMESIARRLGEEYPVTNAPRSAAVIKAADLLVEKVRPMLLVLFGAVGFILLIACVNTANLMLARAASRRREIAVRLSLGASRGRIVRQLLTEAAMLAAVGGIAGLLIGVLGTKGLIALAPPDTPRLEQIGLNPTILLFCLGVSAMTGVFFGLAPALHASRANLQTALKESERSTTSLSWERARKGLLTVEVALAMVLLIGAGLMLRTFYRLATVDPGFNIENMLTMQFSLPGRTYNGERRVQFFNEMLAKVEALPGVRSASVTMSLPFEGATWFSPLQGADKTDSKAFSWYSAFIPVNAKFFETMEIRLLAGRQFAEADMMDTPPTVIINETLARQVWPGQNPVGKRLRQGAPDQQSVWREVIGVVADIKLNGADQETPPQSFLPVVQRNGSGVRLVVRAAGAPLALVGAIEGAIHSVDKNLAVSNPRTMDQVLGNAISRQRLMMALMTGFALLAMVLAAVGVYGVLSYGVEQRRQEIGVRLALGAQTSDVLRLVLRQGMGLALTGVALGVVAALALPKLIASFSGLLFGVKATDPTTFVLIAVLLSAAAFAACWIPARRAARVDPLQALRSE
jgi:putative ABC transport system permease protein